MEVIISATSSLPENANLDYLKDQAKRFLKNARNQQSEAIALSREWHPKYRRPGTDPAGMALHDAQLILARQYGFASWAKLKEEIERRNCPAQNPSEKLISAILNGSLEDTQILLPEPAALTPELREALKTTLPKIVNRSVWHRPQYHAIAKLLVGHGIECSIWDAARVGLLAHVQSLLAHDPSLLDALDPRGRTPLQRAALVYGSHPECEETAAWLMQQGGHIDIFTASAYSLPDVIAAELRRDPSLVHQKSQGSTPLNWAVRPRKEDGGFAALKPCTLLIDAGADLETSDDFESGMHPLHHVCEWGNYEVLAELLIARGADLQAKDDIGWTPLDYALDRNRQSMSAYLKQLGATQTHTDWPDEFSGQSELLIGSAKRNDTPTILRLLKENPALAKSREADGATALHWAAHDGHYELAQILLEYGADVFAQETKYWGGTPLHWAAERQPALVELLLDHGAEINGRNIRAGQTPLHYCARCDDVPEVAELLLKRGADPSLQDNRANRPLDYARKAEHAQVLAVLQQHEAKL